MNPGRRKKTDYAPARVTVAVLTYLPNRLGYFENRLDVTRTCLQGIIKNTTIPYDLMVFDNGSCSEMVNYLHELKENGAIDFLILSQQNIGKIGALQIICQAAPGDVIAYCDDDVFFLPGWLEKHLQVIDAFPKVGLVSGMYIKSHMKEGIKTTLKFSQSRGVQSRRGNLIDPELEKHYMDQMGRSLEKYRQETKNLEDVLITHKGIQVWASAGHYQFVAPKAAVLAALPKTWSGNLMGQMRDLDIAIDELGLLRLCTHPPTLRLLGNQINESAAKIIQQYDVEVKAAQKTKALPNWRQRLYRLPFVQKAAYFLYERLFRIINT